MEDSAGRHHSDITVRVAGDRDLPFLAEHDSHVRPEVLGELVGAGRILVAASDGELHGWLRWSLFWDEIPFMNMLFVLEHHRGQGAGGRLIEAWEDAARMVGSGRVMTSTQADEDAQHLYRRRGYVDCGVLLLPGEPAEILFRKELTR